MAKQWIEVVIGASTPADEWGEFDRRHAGNPFLQCDPLYALEEPLIDAIKDEVRTFFTEDQERFERDLARTASIGFFHHGALGRTRSDSQLDPETGLTLQERYERSCQSLQQMSAESLRQNGLTEGEIDEYFRNDEARHQAMRARMDAYSGWLITNRGFLDEVSELRRKWGPVVQKLGRFPKYPRWPDWDGRVGDHEAPRELRVECDAFYLRWGLDRMVTWDWPSPMVPDLVGRMLEFGRHLSRAGVTIFVPWYLLRGEKLDLQSLVQKARVDCEASHLRDWLNKQPSQSGDDMGDIRFERLWWLYRYHELVLVRRYGAACRGHVQRLDRALARVMGRDADTVKKLRLVLKRALHQG